MSRMAGSRWVDTPEDAQLESVRKQEKETRKRLKAEKARKQAVADKERASTQTDDKTAQDLEPDPSDRPSKRQKITPDPQLGGDVKKGRPLLRFPSNSWQPCRRVENFERLNAIEEGSYGWVSRARDVATGEVVALKKLKMNEGGVSNNDGFPVTGLREIECLFKCQRSNESQSGREGIVDLREVVVGESLNDVYLVMEFLEHDLRTLQEDMQDRFLMSEVKTIMGQIVAAVGFLHDNWILHRDLKTSNILLNNRGTVKLADFGMARLFSDPPPPNLTQLVVTLWYRAPELLLGTSTYGRAVDMWSIGCIFGELLLKEPLLPGRNEVDELSKVFELCGIPTEENWPGFRRLPNAKGLKLPRTKQTTGHVIRAKFPFLTNAGSDLLQSLLELNPSSRPSAEEALQHQFFKEDPRPKAREMFPTFPSKASQEKRRRLNTPNAPKRGDAPAIADGKDLDFSGLFSARENEETGAGFQLKLA